MNKKRINLKVYIFSLLCLLSSIFMNPSHSKENTRGREVISVNSIEIGKMGGDTDPSEFSIVINFSNNGFDINKWQLGFYMPAAFCKLVHGNQNYNPRLIMNICHSKGQCTKLRYDKAPSIIDNDLSQGYTTILAPETDFSLLKNGNYTIELLHNNQWGGGTVSYFPQNLFFILSDRGLWTDDVIVYKAKTNFYTYKFVNYYNMYNTNNAIDKHIESNWSNSISLGASEIINIIPNPALISAKPKEYVLSNNIMVHNLYSEDNQLAKMIANALKFDLNIEALVDNDKNIESGIVIQPLVSKSEIQNNPEGYILEIGDTKILIQAINKAGIYYAFQSLRQIWNSGTKHKNGTILPQLTIKDFPRFSYRGIMLDTVRHFFTVDEIKKLIDLMGIHKLNVLHLHLSDDEGFRLSLPEYPTLQFRGSIRGVGIAIGPAMLVQENLYNTSASVPYVFADTKYFGHYTNKDIANIITYANDNHITVIPEIDFPSHSRALIKSLPEAFIDPNDKSQFVSAQGYTDNVLPVCTYNTNISIGPIFTKTIDTIINKVATLFNGQTTLYAIKNEISIGGDEVSPNAWTNDDSCQAGWKGLSALEKSHKFFKEMSLNNPSIVLSGWQQLIQTNGVQLGNSIVLPQRAGHIWVWNATEPGILQAKMLAKHGYKTVLAFSDKTYFDLMYVPAIQEPGLAWASQYSDTQAALTSAVAATQTMQGLEGESQSNIVGLEGALWSENFFNFHQMTYMALPKMAGLSEAAWSPQKITMKNTRVNWQSLATRLGCGEAGFLSYLNKLYGVNYRGYPKGIKYEVPPKVCD